MGGGGVGKVPKRPPMKFSSRLFFFPKCDRHHRLFLIIFNYLQAF